MMTAYEIEESAKSLYDGGWRAEDKEQLIDEYNLTDLEASKICFFLAEMDS